jgi:hypothetical protein
MKYTTEISMENFKAWSGATDTLETIKEHNKINDLEHLINEMFFEETPTDTQINDLLWHDTDWVFKQLNIRE